jgi:APA family basic amino acid/polyamine antiporter
MQTELQKKYGLLTAISMVVGIVIGSGVFFKAEQVLRATGGNIPLGIAAWGIVGLIMIICSYAFATMATRYERVNGVVDYAEVAVSRSYGYYVGWFMAMVYNPTLTSVLAWVSARYTCVLLGWDITGGSCMVIACFYLVANYALNALSPILAGKFQVATTAIKLIPLSLMAVAGTILGLTSGMTVENFTRVSMGAEGAAGGGLFAAVVAVAFAYEGWILATSINAELRDSKKNLPRALMTGAAIVVAVYILYYIGLAGVVPTPTLMENGEAAAKLAFQSIFGAVGGTLIFVFVIISCLGTLNGLMLACTRGLYALAIRGEGPFPKMFRQVDAVTNMPTNSSVAGVALAAFWLLYFYGANLTASWFGPFSFDTSELPIVTLYAAYIPIFLMMMKKEQDLSGFKRFIMPGLAIIGCVFMVVAACLAHKMAVVYYLIIFAVWMLAGALLRGKQMKRQ